MLFLLPTDTCFGLACAVNDSSGYNRIYEIKGRDFDKPLAIMLKDFSLLDLLLNKEQIDFLKNYDRPWTVLIDFEKITKTPYHHLSMGNSEDCMWIENYIPPFVEGIGGENYIPPFVEGVGVESYIPPFVKGGRGFLPYNHNLKSKARELRKNMTNAEIKIWNNYLRLLDVSVTRQKPLLEYIVDFYIPSIGLVIEIDGDSHFEDNYKSYENKRTKDLENIGLKVIRFTNNEIYENFENVCEIIDNLIKQKPPNPLYQGGIEISELHNSQYQGVILTQDSSPYTNHLQRGERIEIEEILKKLPNSKLYKKLAFRVANNDIQKRLINKKGPIFLTSANLSGNKEKYRISEIKSDFLDYIDEISILTTCDLSNEIAPSDIFEFIGNSLEVKFLRKN